MLRVTTTSGAVYLIDGMKVLREGPYSPGINYATVPDNEWIEYDDINPIVVGRSAIFWGRRGFTVLDRVTTPVVSIEEV